MVSLLLFFFFQTLPTPASAALKHYFSWLFYHKRCLFFNIYMKSVTSFYFSLDAKSCTSIVWTFFILLVLFCRLLNFFSSVFLSKRHRCSPNEFLRFLKRLYLLDVFHQLQFLFSLSISFLFNVWCFWKHLSICP